MPPPGAFPHSARRLGAQSDGSHAGEGMPVGVQAAQEREREAVDQRLEWEVFHRLWRLNCNHVGAAWRGRYKMPIAAYALALLFVQDDPRRGPTVTAATRTWLAGPEAEHRIPLLAKFTEVTLGHSQQPDHRDISRPAGRRRQRDVEVWDLRDELADRCDEQMDPDAVYIGLGFSTLNTTAGGSFAEVCRTATTELDIPGAFCYVSNPSGGPDDHRVLTAERRAARDHGTVTICSHEAFTTAQLVSPYPYAPVSIEVLYQQSPHTLVLNRMWHLDQALRHADSTRRAALPAGRSRQGRPA
jgi:hypothetical protein